uniref:Uncharacterized protein n=1 Tax=viral metagenome TaxID=1070528 RepID=A0A6C0CJ73_9ZZZZ
MSDFATTLKSLLSLSEPLDAIRAWVSETFPDPVVEETPAPAPTPAPEPETDVVEEVVPEEQPVVEEAPAVEEVVPEEQPVVEEAPAVVAPVEEVVPAEQPVVEESPAVVAPVEEVVPEEKAVPAAAAPVAARPTFLPGVPTPSRPFKLRFGLRNKI